MKILVVFLLLLIFPLISLADSKFDSGKFTQSPEWPECVKNLYDKSFNDASNIEIELLLNDVLKFYNCDIENIRLSGSQNDLLIQCLENYTVRYEKLRNQLVTRYKKFNNYNCFKMTALHYACKYQDKISIETLINRGADVNAIDRDGNTPIFYAVEQNNTDIIILLIKNGAKLEIKNDNSNTPLLLLLSKYGHSSVVNESLKILLDNTKNLNETDSTGNNVLLSALLNRCSSSNIEMILKKKNININAKNYQGFTPLILSVGRNYPISIIETLIKSGADVNDYAYNGCTPLHYSSLCEEPVWQLLLKNGAKVNAVDDNIETPAFFAAANNKLSFLKFLKDNGADLNVINSFEINIVNIAAEKSDESFLKYLINNNLSISEKSNLAGNSALHYAAEYGNIKAIDVLLKAGFDINIKNTEGDTPLNVAIKNNKYGFAKELILCGSTYVKSNNDNKSSLDLAIESNNLEMKKLIERLKNNE